MTDMVNDYFVFTETWKKVAEATLLSLQVFSPEAWKIPFESFLKNCSMKYYKQSNVISTWSIGIAGKKDAFKSFGLSL